MMVPVLMMRVERNRSTHSLVEVVPKKYIVRGLFELLPQSGRGSRIVGTQGLTKPGKVAGVSIETSYEKII